MRLVEGEPFWERDVKDCALGGGKMQPEKQNAKSNVPAAVQRHLDQAFRFPSGSPAESTVPISGELMERSNRGEENSTPLPRENGKHHAPPALALHRPEDEVADELPDEAAQIAALIKDKLGDKIHQHYFAGKTSYRVEADEIIVGVGSPFLLSWMQKQYRDVIAESSRTILGPSARVRFEVDGGIAAQLSQDSSAQDRAPSKNGNPAKPSTASQPGSAKVESPAVRPGRHFARLEDFIGGENIALAMTAAREVCQSPGEQYNPLYLHGGVGLGKTHLLEGIYRRMRSKHPSLRVLYLTAEAFTNYFTEALREKSLPGFRQRFRNINVLLIDDLDFLESKRGIQEEFLHTFKQLEGQGAQLVISADRHPRLLSNLSEELMSRCLSGLVCRLDVPDEAARRRIAEAHSIRRKANLSEEVLEYIAQRFSRNVRELQGAINTLATYGRMTNRRVSVSIARRVLADLERDCTRIVRMADVEQSVCQFFGVTPSDLRSGKRIRTLTGPRMLAMFLIRKHTQAAYQEIGQYFGGRNHATVISAEKKVLNWLSENTPMKVAAESWPTEDVIEALERLLQAG